jgi:hypothetical protein
MTETNYLRGLRPQVLADQMVPLGLLCGALRGLTKTQTMAGTPAEREVAVWP